MRGRAFEVRIHCSVKLWPRNFKQEDAVDEHVGGIRQMHDTVVCWWRTFTLRLQAQLCTHIHIRDCSLNPNPLPYTVLATEVLWYCLKTVWRLTTSEATTSFLWSSSVKRCPLVCCFSKSSMVNSLESISHLAQKVIRREKRVRRRRIHFQLRKMTIFS